MCAAVNGLARHVTTVWLSRFLNEDGWSSEPKADTIGKALQKGEDSNILDTIANFVVDGFLFKPTAYVGTNNVGREKDGPYCHFCNGHKKTLDALLLKTLGGKLASRYDFNIVIDSTKPLALELFKKKD